MQVYDAMYNLCNRFFSDNQDIVSAINNGMLRVFKNIQLYDESKSEITTWIYSIVRNEALTIVRNNKNLSITKELTEDFDAHTNPFEEKGIEEVNIYLEKLSETTRAICNLYYLEDYSIKEISTTLEIKEGTIKWHLSEGRKKLQTLFNVNKTVVANVG